MRNIIYIGGFYHLAFAIFHLMFWRLFSWKTDLQKLTPVNRAVMQILNLRLTFVFIAVAAISFIFAEYLTENALGRTILFCVALFWFMRAVEQMVFFGIKNNLSNLMILIFLAGAIIYGYPAWF